MGKTFAEGMCAAFSTQREAQKQGKTLPHMSDGDSCEAAVPGRCAEMGTANLPRGAMWYGNCNVSYE